MGGRKGSNSERELVKLFKAAGWGAFRIAGSGKMDKAPDIIAGKKGVLFVIECKSSSKAQIYVDKNEVLTVIQHAERFNAKPFYAFRFNRHPWKFISAYSLLSINKVTRNSGITFSSLISENT